MDSREIRTHTSNLDKAKDDKTILEILNILKKEIKPTEQILRETKVGVAVNRHKGSPNKEISSLVMKIIKYWRDEVTKEKKLKNASSGNSKKATTNTSTSSTTTSSTSPSASATHEKKYEAKENRDFDRDGVKTSLYENRTRNACVKVLYNALCIDSEHPPHAIISVAKEIETEVFRMERMETGSKYAQKLRTLTSNLRQKNNQELRSKINNGDLTAKEFVKMDPKDMAPEALKKELEAIKLRNMHNAQGATQERAVTDRFTCGKCKEKKVSYYQLQTRSADEPLTTFCTCENCGNRWKFS